MRICKICKLTRLETEFRHRPNYVTNTCRTCENEARRLARRGVTPVSRADSRVYRDQPKQPVQKPVSADVQRLFELTRKQGVDLTTLCDKLDMSPKRVRSLIDEARSRGLQVMVEHNHVGLKLERKDDDRIQQIATVAPVVGEKQKVAVISDTHLGSKYCLREQLTEFVNYAYSQGVREILHPGDMLDGDYRHGKFEMSHMGIEEQTQDLIETLPELPGLTYHTITGNHDFTFTEGSGVDVGRFVADRFKAAGRSDFFAYGDRSAFLKIRGAVIHLWHPKKGSGYARSYAVQKQIEAYSSLKPQILLIGHWHIFCHVYERNVHGIACPTFQGGGSAFGKSLGGSPAIGGLILSWDLTENNTMRSFTLEKRSYVERETIYDPRNVVDAFEVEAAK